MTQTIVTSSAAPPYETTTPKTLLGLGIIAGPIFIATSLVQALTRDGFDLAEHQWSLLANGNFGWIQVTNFMVAGLLTIAFAAGLGRTGFSTLASRLIGVYGLSLVGAGIFRADPALGFPPGAPQEVADPTLSGILHFAFGGIGFLCLVAACFVFARRFAAAGNKKWATYSRTTGILFLAGFAAVASGAQGAGPNLAFTAAVVIAWAWVSALAAHLHRNA